MPQLNFDARQVNPSLPIEAIPSGKYVAEITNSELKPTKAGDGSYLELEFTLVDGEYRGRKLWDRLCLNHPTQKTVEIARANLSAICHAVGIMKPQDSRELHNIPLTITVKAKKDQETDTIFNEVKGYAKRVSEPLRADGSCSLRSASFDSQATQYPQNDATPPWQRQQ